MIRIANRGFYGDMAKSICYERRIIGRVLLSLIGLVLLGLAIAPATVLYGAQTLRAEMKRDRVSVYVEDALFTEYIFTQDWKYPYFYPVNGPRTGKTVTTRETEPWPHHHSLFFACDHVNGGNYWQGPLKQGQISSERVSIVEPSGKKIVLEQDCQWERSGASSPFKGHRRIVITAPTEDRRYIDFRITLTAQTDVRIRKTNHALFSARVEPALSVDGGGRLLNAHGQKGEEQTWGKKAPWMDYSGVHHGEEEGIAILTHPENHWFPSRWFTRNYGFFSPTPMYWLEDDHYDLSKGEQLTLRYRVVVHGGKPSQKLLSDLFHQWKEEDVD